MSTQNIRYVKIQVDNGNQSIYVYLYIHVLLTSSSTVKKPLDVLPPSMYETPCSNRSRKSSDSSFISSRIERHSAPKRLRRFTAWMAEQAFLSSWKTYSQCIIKVSPIKQRGSSTNLPLCDKVQDTFTRKPLLTNFNVWQNQKYCTVSFY